jgi:hypothetical protein
MKKCVKIFVNIGFVFSFLLLVASPSWSSPVEFLYPAGAIYVDLGVYAEIEESSVLFPGDTPNYGTYSTSDERDRYVIGEQGGIPVGERCAYDSWEMEYQLTNSGFMISNYMTLETSYEYGGGIEPINLGYAFAFSGSNGGGINDWLKLPVTSGTPAGTVMSFMINTETSGTPWGNLEWTFTLNGISVNQSNYDQVIFDLIVGQEYAFLFEILEDGLQTQQLVDGSLASGFDLYFSQLHTPVPIPGAIWLLGSGLVGLIGLRRKHLH